MLIQNNVLRRGRNSLGRGGGRRLFPISIILNQLYTLLLLKNMIVSNLRNYEIEKIRLITSQK